MRLSCGLVLALVLSSCDGRPAVSPVPKRTWAELRYPTRRSQVDILFVLSVGSSTEMLREGATRGFRRLHPALVAGTPGTKLSLHVGATSTDLGVPGHEQQGCVPQGGRLWVETRPGYPAGPRPAGDFLVVEGDRAELIDEGSDPLESMYQAVKRLAWQPGCSLVGRVQPLEASRVALSGTNPMFLRPDSVLLVLYVVDTMDCSLEKPELFDPSTINDTLESLLGPFSYFRCFEFGVHCDVNDRRVMGPRKGCAPSHGWLWPIERYRDFFRKLKRPGELILAAIAGKPDPVEVIEEPPGRPALKQSEICYEGGALPELRMTKLLASFPPVLFESKCNAASGAYGNYDDFLGKLGAALAERLMSQSYCLPLQGPVGDAELECEVYEERAGTAKRIPSCDECKDCRCWAPKHVGYCGSDSTLSAVITEALEPGGVLLFRCRS